MFVYGSSTVDWCETNYLISNYICEFQNSFSSFAYCLLTYYQYCTYKKYIVNNKLFFNLLFINNFLLGISSFLFHSTLSYMGQFLDEGFIVTFIFLINIIFSNNYYIVLELLLALSFPTYTRFMLFLIGTRHIYKVLHKNFSKDIISGLKLSLGFFIFSIVFWIIDLLFCNYLLFSIHWLWHIISAVALYNIVIVTIVYKHNNMKLINKYYINDIQTILSPLQDDLLL